jgi:DNA-binding transcriptional regulator YdaS (Cro superfamily)
MNCAERLVAIFGSQAEVARRFRIDRALVSNWVKSGYVPSRWAMEVERATDAKIPRWKYSTRRTHASRSG